ncbi:UPF0755 protein [Geodermatophilus telluris]|uniref:Endolytic murein transglycosylase n=1 Tax=Geodermatophilus telluris TaxID=1190417 RepID=A0A1G6RTK7_9ACTN|nr:endolytic transglycosylase MltG [Geodermatophilus telluris]SDD07919.1 UPF0755 protein [Geodermatophilus telluris]
MSGPVPPYGRGRHAGPDVLGATGRAGGWYGNQAADVPRTTQLPVGPVPARPAPARRGADLLDRSPALRGRHSAPSDGDDRTGPLPGGPSRPGPAPGLPPRPPGAWSRMPRRPADDDTAQIGDDGHADTAHIEAVDGPAPLPPAADPHGDDEDATGGLDVLGGGRREERRRGRRARRAAAAHPEDEHPHDDHLPDDHLHDDPYDGYDEQPHDEHLIDEHLIDEHHDDEHHDDPLAAHLAGHADDDRGSGRRRTRGGRRRRGPLVNLLALLVLAGLVTAIVLGGRALIGLVNPEAQDYAGAGTGTVEVRIGGGDTLSDIARTLVDQDVIASADPFVEAAEADPASMGIQPGVYSLRAQMSGQAALDLLLDPASRLVSRVTVPEGFTASATLQRVAEATGLPIEEVQAAAADPAALGLPAYANGQLEGFLFPATYDVEPGDSATEVLRGMVARFTEVATDLQLEQRAAASGRSVYDVVVVASMIQSETRLDEERPDVAQVVYNRLAQGIPLGIDATLAYGLQKNGNDLTVTDLQTDGPYNTRTRAGLPPSPISSPGEASLEAALVPTTGDLLYYVLESEDGRHFFTADYAEFQAARQRCADAGLGCGG